MADATTLKVPAITVGELRDALKYCDDTDKIYIHHAGTGMTHAAMSTSFGRYVNGIATEPYLELIMDDLPADLSEGEPSELSGNAEV